MSSDIPARLMSLLTRRGQVAALWKRPDALGDATPGMEALALALADAGFSGIEIGAALMRHDRFPQTADAAKSMAWRALQQSRSASVEVSFVSVTTQDPAIYRVAFRGREFDVPAAVAVNRATFRTRIAEATGLIAELPPAKEYAGWFNAAVEDCARLEMPEESSETGLAREFVQGVLETLPYGESVGQMEHGSYNVSESRKHIRAGKVYMKAVRQDMPALAWPAFCRLLRDLGWKPSDATISGQHCRTWSVPFAGVIPAPFAVTLDAVRARKEAKEKQGNLADVDQPFPEYEEDEACDV